MATHPMHGAAAIKLGAAVIAPFITLSNFSVGPQDGATMPHSWNIEVDNLPADLFVVYTGSATQPANEQIAAGQDHTGAAAVADFSVLDASASTSGNIALGDVPEGTYFVHAVARDNLGNYSDRLTVSGVEIAEPNTAPVAVDDVATTTQGSPVTVSPLANDTDADLDALTIVDATVISGGGSAVFTDTDVTYTPPASFTGAAVVEYTVSDGTDTDTGQITVTVNSAALPTTLAFKSEQVAGSGSTTGGTNPVQYTGVPVDDGLHHLIAIRSGSTQTFTVEIGGVPCTQIAATPVFSTNHIRLYKSDAPVTGSSATVELFHPSNAFLINGYSIAVWSISADVAIASTVDSTTATNPVVLDGTFPEGGAALVLAAYNTGGSQSMDPAGDPPFVRVDGTVLFDRDVIGDTASSLEIAYFSTSDLPPAAPADVDLFCNMTIQRIASLIVFDAPGA